MALSSRIRRAVVGVGATVAVSVLVASLAAAADATPAKAPTFGSVSAELALLSRKNEQLTEQFNLATIEVQAKQHAAKQAEASASSAEHEYDLARAEMTATITAQYRGTGLGSTSALLTSRSSASYLEQLSTLQLLSNHRVSITTALKLTKASSDKSRANAEALLSQASSKLASVKTQRAALVVQVAKQKALLNTLTLQQQQAFWTQGTPTLTKAEIAAIAAMPAPSAQAHIAIKFALAQLGKPYVFAAAGPSAFDCSGLTMAAWGAAGIALPHFAATQYTFGTHVTVNQLKPGDLVFFYSPIDHVGMYLGNGLMIHAPTTGEDVRIIPLSQLKNVYVGATRLVGKP